MFGIFCFGDSITFGRGEQPAKGWAGRLKEWFEAQDPFYGLYNLGVPGHTSADLLERFDVECKSRLRLNRPEDKFVVLIGIGGNDCKWEGMPEDNNPRTTLEQFEKNINELIAKAKGYKVKLGFIGLTAVDEARTLPFEETSFKNSRVRELNEIIKKCCEEEEVPFCDIHDDMLKEDYASMLYDGLHPNSKGYGWMFEKILGFLKKKKLIR